MNRCFCTEFIAWAFASNNFIYSSHKALHLADTKSYSMAGSGNDKLCHACERLRPNDQLMLNVCQNPPFCAFAPHKVPLMGLQRLLYIMHQITCQRACFCLA